MGDIDILRASPVPKQEGIFYTQSGGVGGNVEVSRESIMHFNKADGEIQ